MLSGDGGTWPHSHHIVCCVRVCWPVMPERNKNLLSFRMPVYAHPVNHYLASVQAWGVHPAGWWSALIITHGGFPCSWWLFRGLAVGLGSAGYKVLKISPQLGRAAAQRADGFAQRRRTRRFQEVYRSTRPCVGAVIKTCSGCVSLPRTGVPPKRRLFLDKMLEVTPTVCI